MIKILIIGLGSIGQRHFKILSNLENLKIAALRTSKGLLKHNLSINNFYEIEDALKFKPDGVIISNPTSLHAKSALPFLKQGSKVLIEKPIDESLEKTKILKPYAKLIRVAYCMRFNPIMKYLKEKFKHEIPFKVGFKRSFYLPKWHQYADYRFEYTAKKSMGGGIIRTLSHELDLAIDWFGKPETSDGLIDKISFLEIDTDDYAFYSLKTKNGTRISFDYDFFSPINIYRGEAFTNIGMYNWNLNELKFMSYESSKFVTLIKSDNLIEEMYKAQIDDFIDFIKNDISLNTNFNDACEVLNIIEKIDK